MFPKLNTLISEQDNKHGFFAEELSQRFCANLKLGHARPQVSASVHTFVIDRVPNTTP